MSSGNRTTTTNSGDGEAAVEELLRAAQDDLLLKLRLNSHSISDASSELSSFDPDLTRRFQALKTKDSSINKEKVPGDDLATRFAKLKGGGIGSIGRSSTNGDDDDNKEDEVEKVMQWAMDAARLDPSGSEKIDVEDEIDSCSADEEDEKDEEEEEMEKDKKETSKANKTNKKKWFLF